MFPALECDMNNDRKTISLSTLITTGLAVWAITCFFIHGEVIAVYLAIQAATSGVFAWEMRRIERKAAEARQPASVTEPSAAVKEAA